MSQQDKKTNEKRVICAPQPISTSAPASVLSVEVSSHEDVEWQWTHFSNGQSVILDTK
ncbi:MAG: hypothetical protein PUP92_31330 [Rhizonema sp. PD38]|nr:hypothetical protein [Rhizonema sp. PD38]